MQGASNTDHFGLLQWKDLPHTAMTMFCLECIEVSQTLKASKHHLEAQRDLALYGTGHGHLKAVKMHHSVMQSPFTRSKPEEGTNRPPIVISSCKGSPMCKTYIPIATTKKQKSSTNFELNLSFAIFCTSPLLSKHNQLSPSNQQMIEPACKASSRNSLFVLKSTAKAPV